MKVLTATGYQDFSGIRKTIHKNYYEIEFESGELLKCTRDHIFDSINGGITARKVTKYDELYRKDGCTFVKRKKLIRRKFIAYDLIDVDGGNLYYTNGILSHNCSFLGSSNTLIDSRKLQQLAFHEPIVEQKDIKIYEQPKKGHVYIATVDVSAGLGQDYSIITIIDVTTAPYKQILLYRKNDIDPTSFSIVVEGIARRYNMAYLVIESNNDGKIVCKELFDMDYENMINTVAEKGENKIKYGKRSSIGIMMTKTTKKVGCSKLKELIENNVLIIQNDETIAELGTFAANKGSYEAESGKHDDIVMSLVMFAWFSTTTYFVDICGNETQALIKQNRDDDDVHTLLGFVNTDESDSSFDFGFYDKPKTVNSGKTSEDDFGFF